MYRSHSTALSTCKHIQRVVAISFITTKKSQLIYNSTGSATATSQFDGNASTWRLFNTRALGIHYMWEIEVNECTKKQKEKTRKNLEKFKENTQKRVQDVQTTIKSAYSSLKWLTATDLNDLRLWVCKLLFFVCCASWRFSRRLVVVVVFNNHKCLNIWPSFVLNLTFTCISGCDSDILHGWLNEKQLVRIRIKVIFFLLFQAETLLILCLRIQKTSLTVKYPNC